MSLPQVLDISLRKNPLFGNSLFSMGRLQRFVESEVDFDKCFESEIELTYIVANLSAGHEELRGNRTEPTSSASGRSRGSATRSRSCTR